MNRIFSSLAAVAALSGAAWAQDYSAPTAPGSFTIIDTQEEEITLRWTAPYDDANSGGWIPLDNQVGVAQANAVAAAVAVKVPPIWEGGGGGPGGGPCQSYELYVHTSAISMSNIGDATPVTSGMCSTTWPLTPGSPTTSQQVTISNLAGSTTLYFAIRAFDEANQPSPLATAGPVTTDPDPLPPGDVSNLTVLAVTNNSVRVTWTAPADDSGDQGSGAVSLVSLRYWDVSAGGTYATGTPVAVNPLAPQALHDVLIDHLPDGVSFQLGVRSSDGTTWSNMSNVVSALTPRNEHGSGGGGDSPCSAAAGSTFLGALALVSMLALLRRTA